MIADLHNILKPSLVEDNGLVGSMSSGKQISEIGVNDAVLCWSCFAVES
jgi:hypothetical protein